MITSIQIVKCKLIGICGHASAGKDTVGDYLNQTRDNTYKLSFADSLKEAAAAMFGIPVMEFYNPKYKESPNNFWGISPRQIAQFFGTELVRENLGRLLPDVAENFWITRMVNRITGEGDQPEYTEDDVVIIPDVRFQNEYDWVISQGGIIIHLTRDGANGRVGIPGHASEAEINFTSPERTYMLDNNSTKEVLHEKVDKLITHAKIYPFSDLDTL